MTAKSLIPTWAREPVPIGAGLLALVVVLGGFALLGYQNQQGNSKLDVIIRQGDRERRIQSKQAERFFRTFGGRTGGGGASQSGPPPGQPDGGGAPDQTPQPGPPGPQGPQGPPGPSPNQGPLESVGDTVCDLVQSLNLSLCRSDDG